MSDKDDDQIATLELIMQLIVDMGWDYIIPMDKDNAVPGLIIGDKGFLEELINSSESIKSKLITPEDFINTELEKPTETLTEEEEPNDPTPKKTTYH